MNASAFIDEFQEMLQTDVEVAPETLLEDLPEWDSLAIMILITWIGQNCGKEVVFADFEGCRSVADIMALAGIS